MGPAGVVVTIADWMLDPVVCAAMLKGTPRVDLAALVELKRLLMCAADTTHSRGDCESFGRITMTHHKLSSSIASRQMNLLFDAKRSEGLLILRVSVAVSRIAMSDSRQGSIDGIG